MPARPSTSSSSNRGYENSTQIALRELSPSKLSSFFRRFSSSNTTTTTSTAISSTKQTETKAQAASRTRVGNSTTNSTTSTTTTNDNTNASRTSSVSTIGSLPQTTTVEAVANEEFVYKQIMRHHTPITLTTKEAKKLAKLQANAIKLQRDVSEKDKEKKRA